MGKQTLSHVHPVIFSGQFVTCHTYSPELDASTHFELYGPAHYVDALISTNDGLAVPFNVQVRCCTTGDLQAIKGKIMKWQHEKSSLSKKMLFCHRPQTFTLSEFLKHICKDDISLYYNEYFEKGIW